MTKSCESKEQAEEAKELYNADATGQPAGYCHIKERLGRYFIYRNSDNKLLKPLSYSPADLQAVLSDETPPLPESEVELDELTRVLMQIQSRGGQAFVMVVHADNKVTSIIQGTGDKTMSLLANVMRKHKAVKDMILSAIRSSNIITPGKYNGQ